MMIKFVKGLSRRLLLGYLPPFVSTKLGCWLGRWFVSYPMTGVTTQDEAGRCLYLGAGSDIHGYIPLDWEAKIFFDTWGQDCNTDKTTMGHFVFGVAYHSLFHWAAVLFWS
jgi:hypothetical protein